MLAVGHWCYRRMRQSARHACCNGHRHWGRRPYRQRFLGAHMAYPLGWSVIPQLIVRRERWQRGGDRERVVPLVQEGQEVLPDQPVLRLHSEPLDGRAQGVSSSIETADETLPA